MEEDEQGRLQRGAANEKGSGRCGTTEPAEKACGSRLLGFPSFGGEPHVWGLRHSVETMLRQSAFERRASAEFDKCWEGPSAGKLAAAVFLQTDHLTSTTAYSNYCKGLKSLPPAL